jgi:renalase
LIAVIGSGVSGAVCARELRRAGRDVTVFDKGRGPGGRASTRRAPTGTGFDHGAQYFTARSEAFQEQTDDWLARGIAAPWRGRFVDIRDGVTTPKSDASALRYVGAPAMNAIVKDLADEGSFRYGVLVEAVTGKPGAWTLLDADGGELGVFEAVAISAPAPQAAILLQHAAPEIAARAAEIPMSGCWAVMAAFNEPLRVPFEAAYVSGSALAWAARDSSKPGRQASPETWTLHASPEWSESHLEAEAMTVIGDLLEAFAQAAGLSGLTPREAWAHRWRFALPPKPLEASFLFDPALGLGACGDWCGGPRVEGAWLSGRALAAAMLG